MISRSMFIALAAATLGISITITLLYQETDKPLPTPAPVHTVMMYPTTLVSEDKLPTTLPTDDATLKRLAESFGPEAVVPRMQFFLGMNAHLNSCAGGRVPPGVFYVWVSWTYNSNAGEWRVDSVKDASDNPGAPLSVFSEGHRALILKCAREHASVASISEQDLGTGQEGRPINWGIPARFPVTENQIYSILHNK